MKFDILTGVSTPEQLRDDYVASLIELGFTLNDGYYVKGKVSLKVSEVKQIYTNGRYIKGFNVNLKNVIYDSINLDLRTEDAQTIMRAKGDSGLHYAIRQYDGYYRHSSLVTVGDVGLIWDRSQGNNPVGIPGYKTSSVNWYSTLFTNKGDSTTSGAQEMSSFWYHRVTSDNPVLYLQPLYVLEGINPYTYYGEIADQFACNGYNLPVDEPYKIGENTYVLIPADTINSSLRLAIKVD